MKEDFGDISGDDDSTDSKKTTKRKKRKDRLKDGTGKSPKGNKAQKFIFLVF